MPGNSEHQDRGVKLELLPQRQTSKINKDGSLTFHVPIVMSRRHGRKFILTPQSVPAPEYEKPELHDPLIRALGKAFEWKEKLDRGEATSISEIARRENVSLSYAARVLRMTFLAPDIVLAILNGTQPKYLRLMDFLNPFPPDWNAQRRKFGFIPDDL